MPYIEEELEIQCHGENGKYGMLRKLENGKYAVNIHLVDYDEYDQANKIYEKHLPEFCEVIKNTLKQNEEKILSFPYITLKNMLLRKNINNVSIAIAFFGCFFIQPLLGIFHVA